MKKRYILIAVITIFLTAAVIAASSILNDPYQRSRQLIEAIERDDLKTAELLLKSGFEVNTPEARPDMDLETGSAPRVPLSVACEYGDYDMVKLLIDHGARASFIKGTNWNPLHQALWDYQHDDLRTIPLLLEHGADPNFVQEDDNPVLLAASLSPEPSNGESSGEAEQNCLEIFKLLEKYGADIHIQSAGNTNAALEAATFNNALVLQYLIVDKGFDVNCCDSYKQTPLMLSVSLDNAREETIQILLDNGADISLENQDGNTAYDYAMENGNEAFAVQLKD